MAITNYLAHFKTNETFESNKDQLRNDAVAFVGDATIIHTHGTDYYCGSGPVALKSDLSKYATTSALTSGLAGKANTLHTHTISQVSGLQAELDSKLESADLSGYALKTDIPSLSGGASATSGQYVSGVTVSGHKITVTKANLPSVSLSSLGITATAEEINKLDGITATTQELNYVDGVTSNIQTQLNNKAASSHNHSAANITSGTLDLARIPTGTTSSTVALGNHTHSNYLTSSSLSGYATQSWVQSQGYLTSVPAQSWSSITGKPSSFTPSSHTHPISQVTERGKLTFTGAATGTYDGSGNLTINIPAGGGGAGSIAWNDITGKPSTFTPAAHTHVFDDITFGNTGTNKQYLAGDGKFYTIMYSELSGTPDLDNYLTNADLSGYATQSWVRSQGYLTSSSLSGYATQS